MATQDLTSGPLGVYEPIIALAALVGMLVILFGVVSGFRNAGLGVSRAKNDEASTRASLELEDMDEDESLKTK